ncbi:MAG: hypothetical protein OXF30_00090 [Candidatus Saccharibacteria bacterium]|nr:hypothetical protein [Candidatus Saccharibacteria bacterium]
MNKKLIIILTSIIVLLVGIGITIYALTSGDNEVKDEIKDEVKPADATKEVVECPKDTDTIKYILCDADGNLISVEYYGADGKLWQSNKYEYDADGNQIKREDYNADGSLASYHQYEYDADGNLIKSEWFDGDGDLSRYYQYEHDTDGELIKREWFDGDGRLIDTKYYH